LADRHPLYIQLLLLLLQPMAHTLQGSVRQQLPMRLLGCSNALQWCQLQEQFQHQQLHPLLLLLLLLLLRCQTPRSGLQPSVTAAGPTKTC
jgi:hypothetical protein